MSLDIQNVLKVHEVNIKQGLVKYVLPGEAIYDDSHMNHQQKRQNIRKQMDEKQGCRVAGTFEIDRVPGNFHFSTHGYGQFMNQLFRQGLRKFDLTHKINTFHFGNEMPRRHDQRTLDGFVSQKQIPQEFLGITYAYFLQIVQKNTIYSNGFIRQSFFYTVRINELLLPSVPMVMFRYQTNPMTTLEVGEYEGWHSFFIELVAIIGGIFTVSSIVDQMVHSSIRYLLKKHRMGKLN